jgi:hypothetical protein
MVDVILLVHLKDLDKVKEVVEEPKVLAEAEAAKDNNMVDKVFWVKKAEEEDKDINAVVLEMHLLV